MKVIIPFLTLFIIQILSSPLKEFTIESPYSSLTENYEIYGDTVSTMEYVEITSDEPFSSGLLISKRRIPISSFRIELTLQMTHDYSEKQNKDPQKQFLKKAFHRDGHGDGIAIWITHEPPEFENQYHIPKSFKGMTIMMNTKKHSSEEIPSLGVINHIKALNYTEKKGYGLFDKQCFHGSLHGKPFQVIIEYDEAYSEVKVDIVQNGKERNCFKNYVYPISLGQYLTISAGTSDVHDSHRILDLKIVDLKSKVEKKELICHHNHEKIELESLKDLIDLREIENECGMNDEKCKIVRIYSLLGMLSDEIALNLKFATENNNNLNAMYKAIERTVKSSADEKSTSHILEMMHKSQDSLADDTSELFTSIGDLLYRYKHIVGMSLDYEKNHETTVL